MVVTQLPAKLQLLYFFRAGKTVFFIGSRKRVGGGGGGGGGLGGLGCFIVQVIYSWKVGLSIFRHRSLQFDSSRESFLPKC
jgi:hypothetical protein